LAVRRAASTRAAAAVDRHLADAEKKPAVSRPLTPLPVK
jgi:hypothetical protein